MEEDRRIQREDEEIENLARVNQRNLKNIRIFEYNLILIFGFFFCLGFGITIYLIQGVASKGPFKLFEMI